MDMWVNNGFELGAVRLSPTVRRATNLRRGLPVCLSPSHPSQDLPFPHNATPPRVTLRAYRC